MGIKGKGHSPIFKSDPADQYTSKGIGGKITLKELLLNLAVTIVIVSMAIYQNWDVSQIVWKLWVTSLVLGVSFAFFGIIIQFKRVADSLGKNREADPPEYKRGWVVVLGAILYVVVLIVPLTFIHFTSSIFINALFPLLEWDPFSHGMELYFKFNLDLVRLCLDSSWVFILAGLLSKSRDFFLLFHSGDIRIIIEPFKSVFQLHLLIIFFAGFRSVNLISNVPYIFLIFCFFPVLEIFNTIKEKIKTKF